jgi:hypothetical protein
MEFLLVEGTGNYLEGTACVLSAARAKWLLSQGLPLGEASDRLECACPLLRKILVEVNDADWWNSDEERTSVLTPWIDILIDSRDESKEELRRFAVCNLLLKTIIPEHLKVFGLEKYASTFESLPAVIDAASATTGYEFCCKLNTEFSEIETNLISFFYLQVQRMKYLLKVFLKNALLEAALKTEVYNYYRNRPIASAVIRIVENACARDIFLAELQKIYQ